MFTSSAGVFRTRQALGDLRALVRAKADTSGIRVAAGLPASQAEPAARVYHRITSDQACRFRFPADQDAYSAFLLSAALPDDDFPAFILATAVLLADRLQSDAAPDNLFWNWEAFHAQYALAEAEDRAALFNGFRASGVDLDPDVDPDLCLTRSRTATLDALQGAGADDLRDLIEDTADAETAGHAWDLASQSALSAAQLLGFRYLAERPEGLEPVNPETAPLISWRP